MLKVQPLLRLSSEQNFATTKTIYLLLSNNCDKLWLKNVEYSVQYLHVLCDLVSEKITEMNDAPQ